MKRRDFLKTLGVAAGAVAFGGVTSFDTPAAADAFLEEAFQVGDVFTIDGYCAFNPLTRERTTYLQTFVVTAIAESGDVTADISFSPYLYDVPTKHRKRSVGGRTYAPPASACRVTA